MLGHRRTHTREPSRVALLTTLTGGHAHVAVFDGDGNGYTTTAPDGHFHLVRGCEISPANGHRHELTSRRSKAGEA
jgi:hypothetical protein